MDILDVVGARCFKKDEPEDLIDGKVPSGSDFVMLLGFKELAHFYGFKAGLWKGISKMLNKESRNPPAKKTRRG
jgi:hypothetical protein